MGLSSLLKCFGLSAAEPLEVVEPEQLPSPVRPAVYVPAQLKQQTVLGQYNGGVKTHVQVDARLQTHDLWREEQPYQVKPPAPKRPTVSPVPSAYPPRHPPPPHDSLPLVSPLDACTDDYVGPARPGGDDTALIQHPCHPPRDQQLAVSPIVSTPAASSHQPEHTAPHRVRPYNALPQPWSPGGITTPPGPAHALLPRPHSNISPAPARRAQTGLSPPPSSSNAPNPYVQCKVPQPSIEKPSLTQSPRVDRELGGSLGGDVATLHQNDSQVPQQLKRSSPTAAQAVERANRSRANSFGSLDGPRPPSAGDSPGRTPLSPTLQVPALTVCESPKLPPAPAPPASKPDLSLAASLAASSTASSTATGSSPAAAALGPPGGDASGYVPSRIRMVPPPAPQPVHRYDPDANPLPAPPAAVTRQKSDGKSAMKAVRRSRQVDSSLAPDCFSSRLLDEFSRSVVLTNGDSGALNGNNRAFDTMASSDWNLSVYDGTQNSGAAGGGGGVTDSVWGESGGGETAGWGVSAYNSTSLLSEATTVFTNVGYDELDDAVTEVERLLNGVQDELGGQVFSFRLKGYRHRFTGRTSVVAFAEHMHGGEFALKFYCDPADAAREFDIFRRSSELRIGLPDILEMEENVGGVVRLRDGTPLPPFLVLPRGLPLPEWYAMHMPTLAAVLQTLWQVALRLQQLHASGYCHNDVKPANILLLGDAEGRNPQWYLTDYTTVAQAGDQVRARYTLEYASPEMVRGVAAMRAQTIACTRPMDIWSLGVVMFEMLTGEPFFPMDAARDQMRDGLIGLEPLHIEENPRLMVRVPQQGRLRLIVRRMLSREPQTRPHADEVVKAVHDCVKELTDESPRALDEPESPVSDIAATSITRAI